ncbi:MAG TPA: PAS domain S-box protein, partial [bacterium]|nr:PAS domain S-box protein [bacterium]
IDPETFKITDINPAGLNILGEEKGNIIGGPCDVVCKHDCDKCPIMEEGQSGVYGRQVNIQGTKSRGNIPVIKTAEKIYIRGKEYILENFIDISSLKKAEPELRKLSGAVTQSPATVVITDLNGNIEYVNPKFTSVTGYTVQEAMGQNPRILKSGETPDEEYKKLWDTIRSGKEWRGEFRNKRKDGSFFWEAASIAPIMDESGNIVNYLAVKEDITQKKEVELELKKTREALERAMKVKDDFLSVTSHDLKSPLGIVKTSMNLLLDEAGITEQVKEYAEMSLRQANRGLKLISDLLDLKKLEDGSVTLDPIIVSVPKLIREVLEDLRASLEQCGAKVEIIEDAQYEVKADHLKLVQVLSNLVGNAIKYTKAGAKIKITAADVAGRLRIGVHDQGPGITKDKLSVIFEKYEQAGEVVDKKKGHGIGLAIARMICDLHGGRIWAESEQGNGSVFYFELPDVKIMSAPEANVTRSSSSTDKTILVVDDIADERVLAIKALEKEGFRSIEANGWKEALDAIRSKKIDLILLDIEMPEMNGIELLEIIRREKSKEELPVIFYSSRFSNIENYAEYGANDYVNKNGSNKEELISKIKKALRI